ncbi:MAG: histidinol-phosphatase HisJ [Promethearchaeota archaeon]
MEDWHTHNELCHHATGTIEDYVKQAIDLKLKTIGISDHFPYEFLKNIERIPYDEYSITVPEIESYISTTKNLNAKYKRDINVRTGFEIDYFKNQEHALNLHLNKIKKKLDFILGSIHILNFFDGRGAWGFDDSRFRNDYDFYGADKIYMFYYQSQQKMVKSKEFDFDIIAHFDLPKKFNDIPQNKEMVNNEAMKALELIKKRDVVMEINSGGLRKDCKEQYPKEQIIQEMYSLDIPILLGSDAHKPQDIAWDFKKMMKMLKKIGYNQVVHFKKRKKSFTEI